MKYNISNIIADKLKYYIYALRDPRSPIGEYFYIGKGIGSRCLSHISCAIKSDISNLKYDIIKDIIANNYDVHIDILRHNIEDEDMAYEYESICIDMYNISHLDKQLTNIVKGHHTSDYGIQSLDDIIIKYDAKPITLEELELDKYKYVCLNINRSYINNSNLYQNVRGWWHLNYNTVQSIDFVLVIYKGIIKMVYKPDSWEIDQNNCVAFNGIPINDSKFINKSIDHIIQFNQNGSRYLTLKKVLESIKKNKIKL